MKRRTKKRLAVVAIAALAIPVAGLGARSLMLARKERLLETARAEGMEAYARADYPRTLERLGYYVGRRQTDGEALLAFSDAVEQSPQVNNRHLQRAITTNRLALVALPGDPRPLANLVRIYPQLGFARETIDVADQLLAIEPANEEALRAKATTHYRLGQTAEALAAAGKLLEISPTDVWALNLTTDARLGAGEDVQAVLQWLRSVDEAHPDNIDVLLTLARVEAGAGEPELALETLRAAATKAPRDDGQFRRLLIALDAFGLTADSERLLIASTSPEFALIGVERAWKQGRSDVALERARAAVAAGSAPAALAGMLALLEAGRDGDSTVEPLAGLEGAQASQWRALIEAYHAMEKESWTEARDALTTLALTTPTDESLTLYGAAQHLLAVTQSALGNHTEAVAGWRNLLQLDPTWTIAGASLVVELANAGRVDEAYAQGVRLLLQSPNNALAARSYLLAVSRQLESGATISGNLEDIRKSLSLLREAAGANGDLLCLVAQIQIASGDYDGASETLAAIGSLPTPPATGSLIQLSSAAQNAPPALRDAARSLVANADPNDPAVVFARAIDAGRNGRLDEGLRLLDEAIEQAPAESRLALELGRARYLRSIDQRRALEAFLAIAERETTNAMVQTELLNLPLLWLDCDAADAALQRLSAIVGKDASSWIVYDAKRKLVCDGSPAASSDALLALSAVIEADPIALEPVLMAADANIALGDRPGAIKVVSNYLSEGGRDPRAYIKIIPLLKEAGQSQEAREMAERLAQTQPIPTAMALEAGAALEQLGLLEDARRLYLVASEAGDRRADMSLVAFGLRHNDESTARAAVARLQAAPGESLDAFEAIATFQLMRDKDIDAATRTIMEAPIEADPDDRTLALTRSLLLADRDDEARAILDRATSSGAGPRVWAQRVSLDIDAMNMDSAGQTVERALAVHPDDTRLKMLRSIIDLNLGKASPSDAMAAISEALTQIDADPRVVELADILRRHSGPQAQSADLIRELSILTTRRPTYLVGWSLLIQERQKAGQFAEAAEAGRAAAAAMPGDPGALRLAADALARAGRLPEALGAAEQWRAIARSDRLDADLAVAELRARLGRPADGLAIVEPLKSELIARADASPRAVQLYAELLAASGRESEAAALVFERAVQSPEWALIAINVSRALFARPDAARAWLERCESFASFENATGATLGDAWRSLASASGAPQDFARASQWLAGLAEVNPSPAVWVVLADCQAASGDTAQAEASYRRALSIEEDPIAMNNLAGLLAQVRPNDEEARRLAARAVAKARSAKIPPDSLARFVDTLGFAELRAGRHAEALAAFREALSLDPALTDSAVGQIEALALAGDAQSARAALRRLEDNRPRLSPELAERLRIASESLAAGGN